MSATAPATPLGLDGLRRGGEGAPVCRSGCAPAFYACTSGGSGGGDTCYATLITCRRECDALAMPLGRLQSPLPAAGLAPVGPLRPLPGGLPALQ